jgi:cytochrome P450
MLRDPEKYPNPHLFMPERFILKDGTLDHALAKDVELGFGFGRRYVYLLHFFQLNQFFCPRICPGRHLGNSIVWMAATNILATCDILKAKDANGNTIEPGMKLESAITA